MMHSGEMQMAVYTFHPLYFIRYLSVEFLSWNGSPTLESDREYIISMEKALLCHAEKKKEIKRSTIRSCQIIPFSYSGELGYLFLCRHKAFSIRSIWPATGT